MNSAIKGNSGNISFRIRVIYGRLSGNNLQRTTCKSIHLGVVQGEIEDDIIN